MEDLQTFRTAFNGFHREDVVHYIEELNARHEAEISQVNTDMQYLQEKLTQYEDLAEEAMDEDDMELAQKVEDQAAVLVEQSDRIAALEQQLAEAKEACQTAEALLEESEAQNAELLKQLNTALARQTGAMNQQDAELNAYRRAERVERQANERAMQIHDQVNGALSDATGKVDEAAAQIAAMTEAAMAQLKQLQLAVTGSKQVLLATAESLKAIRPAVVEE